MTGRAERIREAHRGWRQAEPAARSRRAALDTFGLRYIEVDDFNVIVEGDYQLNLAMSYWRAIDGSAQGYLVSTLEAEIRKNNPEKPVTDRDSGAAGRTASKPQQAAIAEFVTGPLSSEARSSSLLPVVAP